MEYTQELLWDPIDKTSPDKISELKQIVKNHNWELIDTYVDEGYSRTTTSRPELNRMMRDANIRKFEMVITLELSRLGASLKNMIEIVDKLKEKRYNYS